MNTAIVLDTCAVICIATDDRIADAARAAIEEAMVSATPLMVSPMTAWEVGLLASRDRLHLATPPARWFGTVMSQPGLSAAPLTAAILIESSFLPGSPPNDPVDRIMAATARELGCRLMTRDRALLAYADAGHLRAIAC